MKLDKSKKEKWTKPKLVQLDFKATAGGFYPEFENIGGSLPNPS
jgi:hypothetical protein